MSDVAATDFPVGCTVSVVTQGEQVQGEVFAFDSASDTVLIHQQGSTPFHSNLRLLKVAYLKVAVWSRHGIPSSQLSVYAVPASVSIADEHQAAYHSFCRVSKQVHQLVDQWHRCQQLMRKDVRTERPKHYRSELGLHKLTCGSISSQDDLRRFVCFHCHLGCSS
jgi:hypothetical protein